MTNSRNKGARGERELASELRKHGYDCHRGTKVIRKTVEDVKESYKIVTCVECKHRDPEDKKCDSGQMKRQGCIFPVADDYFCKYGERRADEHTD